MLNNRHQLKWRIFFFIFLFGVTGCVPIRIKIPARTFTYYPVKSKKNIPKIQVAIAEHQHSVYLTSPSGFKVIVYPHHQINSETVDYRLKVTFNLKSAQEMKIIPLGPLPIQVGNHAYQGSIKIIPEQGNSFLVINKINLESYIMGVVSKEVPGDWPLAALEAQAIAARTYAIYEKDQNRQQQLPYDLKNTSLYQMYSGENHVNIKIHDAVIKTQGEIMEYQGFPIMAVFHANCGGHTDSAFNVWGEHMAYLKSVNCPFSKKGKHFFWETSIPISKIIRSLNSHTGIYIAGITSIYPLKVDPTGRIQLLGIRDAQGHLKVISGNTFRMSIGPNIIRSTLFHAYVHGNSIMFKGYGWGHGVGLCQEGAMEMAKEGYSDYQILKYFYHDITFSNVD